MRIFSIMTNIDFVRRSFRYDGGAELASSIFIERLSKLTEVRIVCESWLTDDLPNSLHVLSIATRGLTRKQKYLNFVNKVSRLATCEGNFMHSHELIPGANIIRLGDGLHSSWVKRAGLGDGLFSDGFHKAKVDIEKAALTHRGLDSVIVNSELVAGEVASRYKNARITLIRNTVRREFISEFNPVVKIPKRLLFVGSGWSRKGLSVVLRALSELSEFTLDVYGHDKSKRDYLRLARRLNILDRVNFKGVVRVTPDIYRGAYALVHPAIYEPFPNVAIEALSQGVPVISTLGSGTSDFDEEKGVWTVQHSCPHEIRNAVVDIASVDAKNRMGFREHILQFDSAYLERELLRLYSEIGFCNLV